MGSTRLASLRESTWRAHPVLGALVRLLVLLVPLAAAVVAAVLLTRLLPAATTLPARVGWWAAVLAGSTAVLLVAERGSRRLLPLAVLLELSLVFPDHAPSRLRAARTPSVREMEDRLARLHGRGAGDHAAEAAETLVTLVGILGLHDKATRGHSERVRAFTDLLTDELGLPEEERRRARWAALVHDVGKLTVPSAVLNGGRTLPPEAWEQIRRHPEEGVRIAAGLLPWLGEWGAAVVQHHERWDGTGYPAGLSGEQISRAARIVSVADSFEVMTASRSYNTVRTAGAARAELIRCAGTQFDPAVVRAFVGISLGRLLWVLGPLTWLASVPFVSAADKAGQLVRTGATAAVVGGLVAGGALPGPSAAHQDRVVVAAPPVAGAVPGAPGGGSGAGTGSGAVGGAPVVPVVPVVPPVPGVPVVPVPVPGAAAGPQPLALPTPTPTPGAATDPSGPSSGGGAEPAPAPGPTVSEPGVDPTPEPPAPGPEPTPEPAPAPAPPVPSQQPSPDATAVPTPAPTSAPPTSAPSTSAPPTSAPPTSSPTTPSTPADPEPTRTAAPTAAATSDPATPAPAPTTPPTSDPATSAPPSQPSVEPTAEPTAAPSTTQPAPTTTQPAPTTDPTTDPTPTATADPTATPQATATPTPTPTPTPVTRRTSLYLAGSNSLVTAEPRGTTPQTRTLLPGGSVTFSRAVGEPTGVSGSPGVLLHVLLQRTQGSGQLTGTVEVALSACDSGTCTTLGTDSYAVGQDRSTTTPQPVGGTLPQVAPTDLRAGQELQLQVTLTPRGNADSAELSYGAADVPSRLAVDLTTDPAPSDGAGAVVGLGLLTAGSAALARRRRRTAPVGSDVHRH